MSPSSGYSAPTRPQPDQAPGHSYHSVPAISSSSEGSEPPLPDTTGMRAAADLGPHGDDSGRPKGAVLPTTMTSSNTYSASSGSASSRSNPEKGIQQQQQQPYASAYRALGDYVSGPEDDDWLHDPESRDNHHSCCSCFDMRGSANLITLIVMTLGLVLLFGGYPVLTYLTRLHNSTMGGFGLGGTNSTGQVPELPFRRGLVDPDTPQEARIRMTTDGKHKMNLVFSDEFNQDGRGFYPGDDPYWEAVDLHYWATGDYEWYSPEAVTTLDGALRITLSESVTENLNFRSGMIQSWNKMCFTGGYLEVSLVLPGAPDVSGLWPAAWTMGNLGRAGYGATNHGMWPYTYDACDVGTLKNQTYPTGGPVAAETTGVYVEKYGPGISYLSGQRLSRCTCDGEDHPGPKHADGTYVGRSAPEIDILEASASSEPGGKGHASMSLQLAPFDATYYFKNDTSSDVTLYDNAAEGKLNNWQGGVYQEAASGVAVIKSSVYQLTEAQFDTFGFEYKPGDDSDSYITWTLGGDPVWTLHPSALRPNPEMEIGQRQIPKEPMYIILNVALSAGFSRVEWDKLKFPAVMSVDYVRLWQVEGQENIGCDPPDFPTADYIERHAEVYWNSNLTTWTEPRERGGYASTFPRNSMFEQC